VPVKSSPSSLSQMDHIPGRWYASRTPRKDGMSNEFSEIWRDDWVTYRIKMLNCWNVSVIDHSSWRVVFVGLLTSDSNRRKSMANPISRHFLDCQILDQQNFVLCQVSDVTIFGSQSGTRIVMDRKSRFTAIKTNDVVDCKFLSHVNTFRPVDDCQYWHSLNNNATPCALATYTHPFIRPLTIPVRCLTVWRLPHPDWNISSIIVSLSDGSVSYTQTIDIRGQHTQFSVHTEVHQPSVWWRLALYVNSIGCLYYL